MNNYINFNKNIINLSSALLVGFLGIIFLFENKTQVEVWLSTGTVLSLCLSVIFNIWHNYRVRIRTDIFNKKIKHFADTSLRPALKHVYKIGKHDVHEDAEIFFREHRDLIKNKTKEEIAFYLELYFDKNKDKNKDSLDAFVGTISEGLFNKIEKLRKESLLQPLEEKCSKSKWLFDRLSSGMRFYIFVTGIIFFLITTILLLFKLN